MHPGTTVPICDLGKRITCVVDGDKVWFRGMKYRLEEMGRKRIPAEKGAAIPPEFFAVSTGRDARPLAPGTQASEFAVPSGHPGETGELQKWVVVSRGGGRGRRGQP